MKILFRADGGNKKGLGHLSRSISLANNLSGHESYFLVNDDTKAVDFLNSQGTSTEVLKDANLPAQISQIRDLVGEKGIDFVFLDLYNGYPQKRRQRLIEGLQGLAKIGVVGFFNESFKGVDFSVNYFAGLENGGQEEGGRIKLAGPNYMPLKPGFQNYHGKTKQIEGLKKILICTGGEDRHRLNAKALEALSQIEGGLEVTVIMGPATNYELDPSLISKIRDKHSVTILERTQEMPRLFFENDLGIIAGGDMDYEAACVGMPSLYLCQAPHQLATAQAWQNKGAGINLGYYGSKFPVSKIAKSVRSLDVTKLKKMSKAGKENIDGQGLNNILNGLQQVLRK